MHVMSHVCVCVCKYLNIEAALPLGGKWGLEVKLDVSHEVLEFSFWSLLMMIGG